MSQYIYFIGIDVSKQHLDHPVVQDEKVLTNKRSTSTPKAILKAVKGLQKQVKGLNLANTLFSLEHTGIDAHINEIDATPLSALLFQTGYLTMQDYKVDLNAYQLDFPNKEVRNAFFSSMLAVLGKLQSLKLSLMAEKLRASLNDLELDTFIEIINDHFARIPYSAYPHAKEGHYQALFLAFLELSGIQTQGEVATNKGRIDILCQLAGMFYIFELKVDQEAAIGMEQTLHQEYSQRCRDQGEKIVVLGVKFSSTNRGIAEWQGELLDENGALIRKLAPEAEQ